MNKKFWFYAMLAIAIPFGLVYTFFILMTKLIIWAKNKLLNITFDEIPKRY